MKFLKLLSESLGKVDLSVKAYCAGIVEEVVSMAYWNRSHIHHSFPFCFIL